MQKSQQLGSAMGTEPLAERKNPSDAAPLLSSEALERMAAQIVGRDVVTGCGCGRVHEAHVCCGRHHHR